MNAYIRTGSLSSYTEKEGLVRAESSLPKHPFLPTVPHTALHLCISDGNPVHRPEPLNSKVDLTPGILPTGTGVGPHMGPLFSKLLTLPVGHKNDRKQEHSRTCISWKDILGIFLISQGRGQLEGQS